MRLARRSKYGGPVTGGEAPHQSRSRTPSSDGKPRRKSYPASIFQRRSEKAEQAAIVQLLQSVGAAVYVLGTRRKRGDYQGTMQTPGLPDLLAFVPMVQASTRRYELACIEVKVAGARRTWPQSVFAGYCEKAGVCYQCGTLDDVLSWLRDEGLIR